MHDEKSDAVLFWYFQGAQSNFVSCQSAPSFYTGRANSKFWLADYST